MQMKEKKKKDAGEEWLPEEISEEVFKENEKLYKRLAKK